MCGQKKQGFHPAGNAEFFKSGWRCPYAGGCRCRRWHFSHSLPCHTLSNPLIHTISLKLRKRCNTKCVKYQLQTFVVWPADLRPAIFHLRRFIATVAGRPKGLPVFIGGFTRQVQASFSAVAIQTVASVLCTPLGVRAPVAQRQSTGNSHAVRCAGKKNKVFTPRETRKYSNQTGDALTQEVVVASGGILALAAAPHLAEPLDTHKFPQITQNA